MAVPAAPLALAAFLAVLPLPGILLLLRLGLHRDLPGAASVAAVAALLATALASIVALGAALAGVFSLGLVAGALLGIALALALAGGPGPHALIGELRAVPLPAGRQALAGAAVAALLAFLYVRPAEQFLGGWDPGVYVNTGASIARTGSLAIRDATLAGVPPSERGLFLHERRGLRAKYPGFIVRDGDRGDLRPYFTHLFPAWVALLDAGLGPRAGLYAAPLFALASAGLLALLGALLFDAAVGAAAALLFGLSIPAIWTARFQLSEPLALFFSLGGWIAATRFLQGARRAWAAVAALAFGCALLAKITTALPLLVAIGAVAVLAAAVRDRSRLLLAVALAGAAAAAVPYALTACREYVADVFRSVVARRGLLAPAGLALGAAFAAAALAGGALIRRFPAAVRAGAAALLALLAAAAWFLRPLLERSSDAANLPQLGWFVTPGFLLLSLAGLVAALLRPEPARRGQAQLAYLAAAATTSALLLHHKQIAPIYLWALRRYVPELLPAAALFGAVALAALRGGRRWRHPRGIAAAALLAAICGAGLWKGRHVLALRENAGALSQVAAVAALVPEGALTVCVDGWLATPLERIFGRPTLAIADVTPEKGARAARAIAGWAAAGREVYLAVVGGNLFTREFGLAPAGRVAFDLPELDRRDDAYPRLVRRFSPEVALFRVVPFADPAAQRSTLVDVALAPFGLGEGFHQAEKTTQGGQARAFRWTGARATIDLPAPGDASRPWQIALSLGGGRPAGVAPPRVRVLVDGVPAGEVTAGRELSVHRVVVPGGALPPSGLGFVELTLESETFVPSDHGPGRDARSLGVMWESAAISP